MVSQTSALIEGCRVLVKNADSQATTLAPLSQILEMAWGLWAINTCPRRLWRRTPQGAENLASSNPDVQWMSTELRETVCLLWAGLGCGGTENGGGENHYLVCKDVAGCG